MTMTPFEVFAQEQHFDEKGFILFESLSLFSGLYITAANR